MTGLQTERGASNASTSHASRSGPNRSAPIEDRDVVVIGGGHNGLVAANYLADSGLLVTVLEANPRVGGMTSCHRPIEGAPDHVINSFAVDAFFWDSFPPSRELGLERYGLRRTRIDPGHVYLGPEGESIGFWADASRTAAEVAHFSRADGRRYLEFAEMLDGFADMVFPIAMTNPTRPERSALVKLVRAAAVSRRELRDIAALMASSVTELVAEKFEHPVVRDAIHATCGSTIPNNQSGSGVAFLWMATMHRYACERPVGGVQAIPDALERRLLARGGTVRCGAVVQEILISGARAVGVRLLDATEVHARVAVVAACDPRQTLERLLPSGVLSPEQERRVRAIPTSNLGYGQAKVDVALSGRLRLARHQKWRRDDLDLRKPSHTIGTEAAMERTFARSGAGLLPADGEFSLWPVIPTALDTSQAPDGQDTLYLYVAVAPYRLQGGWEHGKDALGRAVVSQAAEYYDGLEELEIGRQVLTNDDIGRLTHSTGGNVTHVDMTLGRAGPLRPARGFSGYRTPVEGLFLTGAGTHPGGGITGAPGYAAAREVLRATGRTSRSGAVTRARALVSR
jgi:phytoene dehydrogenase-like protein